MTFLLKIFYLSKFIDKTVWCFQNFLTMEFYRKICNKCYWSNIYNSKHSKFKQSLILIISFISVLFFSFFYLPTDPANSDKSSFFIRIKNFVSGFKIMLQYLFKNISNQLIQFSSSFIILLQKNLIHFDIIRLKSSFLI